MLNYSTLTSASSPSPNQIFDRQLKRAQKNRSALLNPTGDLDYVKDEIAARLVDRLLDIKRRFPKVLDIGAGSGHILKQVDKDMMDHLVQLESSGNYLIVNSIENRSNAGYLDKKNCCIEIKIKIKTMRFQRNVF
jgi:hypothetical protein